MVRAAPATTNVYRIFQASDGAFVASFYTLDECHAWLKAEGEQREYELWRITADAHGHHKSTLHQKVRGR